MFTSFREAVVSERYRKEIITIKLCCYHVFMLLTFICKAFVVICFSWRNQLNDASIWESLLVVKKSQGYQVKIWMTQDGSARVENSPDFPGRKVSFVLFKMVLLNFAGNKCFLHFIVDSFCVKSGRRSSILLWLLWILFVKVRRLDQVADRV